MLGTGNQLSVLSRGLCIGVMVACVAIGDSASANGVYTAGRNYYGQLGDGTTTDSSTSVQVVESGGVGWLTDISAVSGGGNHTLALKDDGTVWAWGYNFHGSLGDGTYTDQPEPVQAVGPNAVGYLNDIIAVASGCAGASHSVALGSDGTVWTWGSNNWGQLGDGTTTKRNTPAQVAGVAGVTAIAAGTSHTLALKNDGTVWAWGRNSYGQLGDGTTTNATTPVQVSSIGNVSYIVAGDAHSLALKEDGTVWAWGYNYYGQLGDAGTTDQATPVQVAGPGGTGYLNGVAAIAAGGQHSLALQADGTIWGWGWNMNGQLGQEPTGDWMMPDIYTSPIQGPSLADVSSVAAGNTHSLVLKNDGTVWAWGYNSYGQLGGGSTTDAHVPTQVVDPSGTGYLSGIDAISAGREFSIFLQQPEPVIPRTIYVDADAGGANDGTSWGDAYASLQDALDDAIGGDEIWVAAGIYKPTTAGDRNASFQLISGVELYGGFVGDETSRDQRDWETNTTILSGDIGVQGVATDNSYHVLTGNDVQSSAILDGLTITQGYADAPQSYGPDGYNFCGGGMINREGSSPHIRHCTFTDNYAEGNGGALFNYGDSDPLIENCLFSGNHSDARGGALANQKGVGRPDPTVQHCRFIDNTASEDGGAIMSLGDTAVINSIFSGNSASADWGGGGAFFHNWGEGGTPSFINCTFSQNTSQYGGGAIYLMSDNAVTVSNCIFWGNTAPNSGSQIYFTSWGAGLTVEYCAVQNGQAGVYAQGEMGMPVDLNWGPGIVESDPLLADATNDDLRLTAGSPCIDAGDNDALPLSIVTDLDGKDRRMDDSGTADTGNGDAPIVDMGAYEYEVVGPAPSIVTWKSVRNHGTLGEIGMPLAADDLAVPSVETRRGGIEKIVVEFDQAVQPVDGDIGDGNDVTITAGQNSYTPQAVSLTNAGQRLEMTFIAGTLPSNEVLTVDVADKFCSSSGQVATGDQDCQIQQSIANVNNDSAVNLIDIAVIKSKNRQPVSETNAQYDVNADGAINLIDVAFTRAQTGS